MAATTILLRSSNGARGWDKSAQGDKMPVANSPPPFYVVQRISQNGPNCIIQIYPSDHEDPEENGRTNLVKERRRSRCRKKV